MLEDKYITKFDILLNWMSTVHKSVPTRGIIIDPLHKDKLRVISSARVKK